MPRTSLMIRLETRASSSCGSGAQSAVMKSVVRKIDLRIGPAPQTLDALLAANEAGRFDFAFIDADKTAHEAYYERCLRLVRAGGLICIDNSLWGGAVADDADQSADTRAIRALNAKLQRDERVTTSLLAVGDGLMLAYKR